MVPLLYLNPLTSYSALNEQHKCKYSLPAMGRENSEQAEIRVITPKTLNDKITC
jgi:hypothetical protein